MSTAYTLSTSAPTGSSVYCIIRNASVMPWSVTAGSFTTWVNANYANYAISLTEQGTSGFFSAAVPAGITQVGFLNVEFFIGSVAESNPSNGGGTFFYNGGNPPVPPTPPTPGDCGQYACLLDMNNIFGSQNILAWSDLNNTGSLDSFRVQAALNWADATIISLFNAYGNYVTPLAPIADGAVIVTNWDATLAGIWLYESRGLRDEDDLGNHLHTMKQTVFDQINDYRSHNLLNAARRWPQASAPVGYGPRGSI